MFNFKKTSHENAFAFKYESKESKSNMIDINLRIDKSYTIYLKLLTNFPNSQITAT